MEDAIHPKILVVLEGREQEDGPGDAGESMKSECKKCSNHGVKKNLNASLKSVIRSYFNKLMCIKN